MLLVMCEKMLSQHYSHMEVFAFVVCHFIITSSAGISCCKVSLLEIQIHISTPGGTWQAAKKGDWQWCFPAALENIFFVTGAFLKTFALPVIHGTS